MFGAGLASGVLLGNWNPFYKLMGKEPPTKQLSELQVKLEETKAKADAKQAELTQANAQERADLEKQIQSAQGDALGAGEAIKRVPLEHQTAEVKLAASMVQRVSLKLARAIGALPPDQRDAMITLIDQLLSEKQAEIDEALRKLAQRDAEFAIVSKERDSLITETIPTLKREYATVITEKKGLETQVKEVTNQVSAWADKKAAADEKAHSFSGALENLWWWIKVSAAVLVGGYIFFAFIIPGIVKHMEAGPLKTTLRNVSGFVTSPMLYLDAKKKIPALQEKLSASRAPFSQS